VNAELAGGPKVDRIDGNPTAEEVAAIIAAIEMSWPRLSHVSRTDPTPRWRFSGRWWGEQSSWPPSSF
jgi:hypothetical protein